jgi:branched-chain amino acid transport system ATP-binding protein
MLALARALVPAPRVLLLDEPTAGLAPALVEAVLARLRRARELGVTIVLVEQNTRAALAVADRGCVLVEGRPRLLGTTAELTGNPEVARLYLGAR